MIVRILAFAPAFSSTASLVVIAAAFSWSPDIFTIARWVREIDMVERLDVRGVFGRGESVEVDVAASANSSGEGTKQVGFG